MKESDHRHPHKKLKQFPGWGKKGMEQFRISSQSVTGIGETGKMLNGYLKRGHVFRSLKHSILFANDLFYL